MGSARSIGTMQVLNGAGVFLAVGKSLVLANAFGTGRGIEVYFASVTLFSLVEKLTQQGYLADVFLPVYHQKKVNEGRGSAQGALAVVLNWTLLSFILISAVLWWTAPWLVSLIVPGFEEPDQRLAFQMFRWLIPLTSFTIASSFLRMQANAESQFGRPEAITVAQRIVDIVLLIALIGPFGVWAAVISLWAGNLVSFVGDTAVAYGVGYRHRFTLFQKGFSAWTSLFDKLPSTLAYTAATQLFIFVTTAMLSQLPQGTYAVTRYAHLVYAKTNAALIRPVGVVFFTQVSEAWVGGQESVKRILQTAASRYLAVWGVTIAVVVVAGRPLIGALWGSDSFGAEELDLAFFLLIAYFTSMLLEMVQGMQRRMMIATGAAKAQYRIGMGVQLLTAAGAWLLIPAFGVAGLVANLAIDRVVNVVVAGLLLWRWHRLSVLFPARLLRRWAVCVGSSVLVGYLLMESVQSLPLLEGRIEQFVRGLLLASVAVLMVGGVAWMLNIYEVREALRRASRLARAYKKRIIHA